MLEVIESGFKNIKTTGLSKNYLHNKGGWLTHFYHLCPNHPRFDEIYEYANEYSKS